MMYAIVASVAGGGMDAEVVCCFDPTVVVVRLRRAFPEIEIDPQDRAWRMHDEMQEIDAVEGAVRIAERDAQRRGPLYIFRFPSPSRAAITGRAERYNVRIWSDEAIPEPLRSQFIDFLETLRFAACVSVKSVRLEGNNEYPA
jgi:hypothetical protein